MNRDAIIAKLETLRPSFAAEGVLHIAIFGSRARGDEKPTSDLDILLDVDPAHNFSILNLVGVEEIASDATGLTANAFMRRGLNGTFAHSIRNDVVEVF